MISDRMLEGKLWSMSKAPTLIRILVRKKI